MTSKKNSTTTSTVFFGTGDVSLATLQGIHAELDIEAVITKPDLLTSSGHKKPPAVKVWAEQHSIPCYQPANKAELSQLLRDIKFSSAVGLVVDYGIIIPPDVLAAFPNGLVNSHFSLLPKWRGADPITWPILAGDKETGVTIMQVDEGMDTGDILYQEAIEIAEQETTASLTDKLIKLSNRMITESLPAFVAGELAPTAQDNDQASYSTKITKEMGAIDSELSAAEIERQIRAFQDWPGSYLTIQGTLLTIKSAKVSQAKVAPGQLTYQGGQLLFGCTQDSLEILQIQPAGKKPMDAKSFANGYARLLA